MTKTQTPSQTELVTRLRLATLRLARRLRREAGSGITPTLLSVLSALARRGSMTVSELADAESVQPPSMTAAVNRLEALELVSKTPDATDRRVQRVALTAAGEKLVRDVRSRKDAYLARKLRALDPDDVAALEQAVDVIERLLRDDA